MNPHIWHPFTIQKNSPEPKKVVSGEGIWLELDDGTRIVDCISSWWVNIHGHTNPVITEAIHEQAKKLEHVIFANFTHDPAEKIADVVTNMLPGKLNKVFFSDNGSTAVEVAIKTAVQYWQNLGKTRNKIIAFEGAYHGDTFGAMSAGARTIFSEVFENMLFEVDFVDYPHTWEGDENIAEKEDRVIEEIEKLLVENPDEYAAIIIEPLIQGAGGMRICREEFLQRLHWVNRQFETLLIFDEVMTGFGRTGKNFASIRSQVEPDIICLAKGLTGGFLPLSITVSSDAVYETFYSEDPHKTFWHGHSYTANPLGCAAAIASMEILAESQERIHKMESEHHTHLADLRELPIIENVRVKGTISAFDLTTKEEGGYLNSIAQEIKTKSHDYGLLIRPLGNTVYLMPPYCITEEELGWVYRQLKSLIEDVY
ncbi:MAG: adenosylmethionine--8-amino-7-oxononanoate transaminase [Balneolaceae bacterium]|nr:adenosylmethionine--8-amino-7-oxononanoate transaminase [Balneolaceae bacterium]